MKVTIKNVISLYNKGLYDLKLSAQLLGMEVLCFIESLFDTDITDDWNLSTTTPSWAW